MTSIVDLYKFINQHEIRDEHFATRELIEGGIEAEEVKRFLKRDLARGVGNYMIDHVCDISNTSGHDGMAVTASAYVFNRAEVDQLVRMVESILNRR